MLQSVHHQIAIQSNHENLSTLAIQPTSEYLLYTEQRCSDLDGYEIIMDESECLAASIAVGKSTGTVTVHNHVRRQCGCVWHPWGIIELFTEPRCNKAQECTKWNYGGCLCKRKATTTTTTLAEYVLYTEQRCSDLDGYEIIMDESECLAASIALGKSTGTVDVQNYPRQCGCSWHPWGIINLFTEPRCSKTQECTKWGIGGCLCKRKQIQCAQAACPSRCNCLLGACSDSLAVCLANPTCAQGRACGQGCGCGDTGCFARCAAVGDMADPATAELVGCFLRNCAA